MASIFISYRREDSAAHAGRLLDRLAERFGADAVFMDVADLAPGQDFADEIDARVARCRVLLALIGRRWLQPAPGAPSRLFEPGDFVRREIVAALERGITVVPVLVAGATMPPGDALPEDLRALTRLQAHEILDRRFHADVDDLIAALADRVTQASAAAGFEGEWAASLRYSWGVEETERFSFEVDAGELFGTAGFLGRPRAILEGRVDGDRIRFVTVFEEVSGSETRRVRNGYRGRLDGELIRFRLQDDRGYPAVKFEARRVGEV